LQISYYFRRNFDKETIVYENWVQGSKYVINDLAKDIRGEYELTFDSKTYKWSVGRNSCPKIRD
jgi:hypothetical protein